MLRNVSRNSIEKWITAGMKYYIYKLWLWPVEKDGTVVKTWCGIQFQRLRLCRMAGAFSFSTPKHWERMASMCRKPNDFTFSWLIIRWNILKRTAVMQVMLRFTGSLRSQKLSRNVLSLQKRTWKLSRSYRHVKLRITILQSKPTCNKRFINTEEKKLRENLVLAKAFNTVWLWLHSTSDTRK